MIELLPLPEALIGAKVVIDPQSPLYAELIADAQSKLTDAHGIVFDYLAERYDPTWTAATAPRPVLAMIRKVFASLVADLGDDERNENTRFLWDEMARVLRRLRDSAVA